MAEVDAIASEHLSAFETEQEEREAFRVIENHRAKRYELEIDAEAAKDSRRRARENVGASRSTMSGLESESNNGLSDCAEALNDEYFLDSEFVAIYW